MDIEKILFQSEASAARLERTIVRLWILLILMLFLLIGTNGAWIYYESQFEDVVTTQIDAEQQSDGGGSNYVVNGNYGEAKGQDNDN